MDNCTACGNYIPLAESICPHCARPALYPNVKVAQSAGEKDALRQRYSQKVKEIKYNGCNDALQRFEKALKKSNAVIARSVSEARRLAKSDSEGYATYYQLAEAQLRFPSGDKWDTLRRVVDSAVFPGYGEKIRFGALSMDGCGLLNYGECFLVLREDMIAHRSTVFEENTALFMDNHDIKMSEADNLPKGYRATWDERDKLCVCKLADKLTPTSDLPDFSRLLIQQGKTTEDDDFVEVHTWGPLTVRSLDCVVIHKNKKNRVNLVIIKALRHDLEQYKVAVKIV